MSSSAGRMHRARCVHRSGHLRLGRGCGCAPGYVAALPRALPSERAASQCRTSAVPFAQKQPQSPSATTEATILVGDIGGTNARFDLRRVDLQTGAILDGSEARTKVYKTNEFPRFHTVLCQFLSDIKVEAADITSCCLACAGPVVGNKCDMTNLEWVVDGRVIEKEFGFRTAVLNDFVAVGYAIPTLGPDDLLVINDMPYEQRGPIAVLGPGTGLGEVQLMWDSGVNGYVAWASEGSHAGFAPRGQLQRELLEFAEQELEMPCEVEHVACGTGLKRIYRFICHKRGAAAQDLSPADITTRAIAPTGSDLLCSEAVDLFVEIIGSEAGAMALRSLATGGVFIAGGIPPKIQSRLSNGNLLNAFLNPRSRFSLVMQNFPLFVVQKEVGLQGVLQYAIGLAQGKR